MIENYIKTALRNMSRQKIYSIVNVIGLAIGLAACILILLYLVYELSYDRHFENSERIYRVVLHGILGTNEFNGAVCCAPLAKALRDEFPEVVASTRVRSYGYPVLRYKDKVFSEELWYHADSTFFDVFAVEFLRGDPRKALTEPNAVVITESMKQKYFGDEDPMGKILNADRRRDWKVTGVIRDFPANTHFHFDFLASFIGYGDADSPIWVSNNFYTYFLLQEGADYRELEKKLAKLVIERVGPQVEQFLGVSWDQLVASGAAYQYTFQPLHDIHLHSHLDFEVEPNGNAIYITLFSIIAVFILIIACINFMNLATARSMNRAREVGIRKTLGSKRSQLIGQFLAESIILTFIAALLAVVIVMLLLPGFGNLIQIPLKIHLFDNFHAIPLLLLTTLFVGILAGIYPAFLLSSFRPARVLSVEKEKGSSHAVLRKILVVFQFIISITLFSGSYLIYAQLNHMQNKDLGFDKENLLILEKTDDLGAQFWSFKQELLAQPGIVSVSNSITIPGRQIGNNTYSHSDATLKDAVLINFQRSDVDFVDTYNIDMVDGHFFTAGKPADSAAVVLNEAAVKELGIKNPVGKYLIEPNDTQGNRNIEIIGVMQDFHYQSLHRKIDPIGIFLLRGNGAGRTTTIRLQPDQYQSAINSIREIWHKYAGEQAFEYVFFDNDFNRLYLSEIRTRQIVVIFSVLAIVIACLGLFGLASFMAVQRTKEIGIRKTLGASVPNIIGLMTKDFMQLILIAALLAFPISFFLMRSWLQNFAYRIGYSYLGFIASALVACLIAIFTIINQTYRAARINPTDALKYE